MLQKKVTYKYEGTYSNGDYYLGFAGCYRSGGTYYATDTRGLQNQRYFGSRSGTEWYLYCAELWLPAGKRLNLNVKLKASVVSGDVRDQDIQLFVSTEAPREGTELCVSNAYLWHNNISKKFAPIKNDVASFNVSVGSHNKEFVYLYFDTNDEESNRALLEFEGLEVTITYDSDELVCAPPEILKVSSYIVTPNDLPSGTIAFTIKPGEILLEDYKNHDFIYNLKCQYKDEYGQSRERNLGNKTLNENNQIFFSYIDDLPSYNLPPRGEIISFYVIMVSNSLKYNASERSNTCEVTVNSLPSAPEVKFNTNTISAQNPDYPVKIIKLTSTDKDNQTLFYQARYELCDLEVGVHYGEWFDIEQGQTLYFTNFKKDRIEIRAFDGLEYSKDTTYIQLNINRSPSLTVNAKGQELYGNLGPYYTRTIAASADYGDEFIRSYKWHLKPDRGEIKLLGQKRSLSEMELPWDEENYYQGFEISLTIVDEYNDTWTYSTFSINRYSFYYAIPCHFQNMPEENYYTFSYKFDDDFSEDNGSQVLEGYYSRHMKTTIKFSQFYGCLLIKKMKFSLMDEEEVVDSKEIVATTFYPTRYEVKGGTEIKENLDWDFEKTKNKNKLTLRFQCFATNDNQDYQCVEDINIPISFCILVQNVIPENNINEVVLNLRTEEQPIIIVNGGVDRSFIHGMRIVAEINNELIDLDHSFYSKFEYNGASSSLQFKRSRNMFQSLKLISNKDYLISAYLIPVNIAGEGEMRDFDFYKNNKILLNFKVIHPSYFKEKEDYDSPHFLPQSYHGINGYLGPNWEENSLPSNTERMINPEEFAKIIHNYTIQRTFDLYYDGSGNPPVTLTEDDYKYSLQYYITNIDNNPTINQQTEWISKEEWSNIEAKDFLSTNKSFKITQEMLSSFELSDTSMKKIFFRITAIDKYGYPVLTNEDTTLTGLHTPATHYLIIGRKVEPDIIIENCQFQSENGPIEVKFCINDFGGNDRGYSNFERKLIEKSGKEGEYSIEFWCGNIVDQLRKEKVVTGSISSLNHGGLPTYPIVLLDSVSVDISSRLYVQAKITFYTNELNAFIQTETPIFIVYMDGPSVSYRAHHLGINTAPESVDNSAYDILTISDFRNKRYVHLKGEYSDKENGYKPTDILIDLRTGLVSGLTVDCGGW